MKSSFRQVLTLVLIPILLTFPVDATAITAAEILDRMFDKLADQTFRAELQVTTCKGEKRLSRKAFWLMGRIRRDESSFFVEFEEPEASKGIRFLFQLTPNESPRIFMYVPSLGRTVRVESDDASADIGETGVDFGDLMVLFRRPGQKEEYLGQEVMAGLNCHLVRITMPNEGGTRLIWIADKLYQIVKSVERGPHGKVTRTARVVEFFETAKGQLLPREHEVTVPEDGIRMRVRAMHGFQGIIIPESVLDPVTFGTHQWRR